MDQKVVLTDEHLISLLTKVEDSFVERKPVKQRGEWLQTVVAFANSTPIGYPAVLFIGVDNLGQIADGVESENVIKSFSDFIESHAWPPIYTLPQTLTHFGKTCVAVIIPGSSERPHFAGRSYIRLGTQTKEASEQHFAELIAQRNSKARELLTWAGKQVSLVMLHRTPERYNKRHLQSVFRVMGCNAHYVTLERAREGPQDIDEVTSYPLNWIELGFDHKQERLFVYIYPDR